MSLTPFYIPDSSPLLAYAGPSEWKSAYTPRGDGYDQTFHQVSGAGNTVSFNLTFSHSAVSAECALDYSVNGSDFRSTCDNQTGLKELPYGLHQVVLRTGNVTVFQLFGIVGNYGTHPNDQQYGNTTYEESDSTFTYTPATAWNFLSDGAGAGRAGDYSVAVTTASDAKIDFAFKGELDPFTQTLQSILIPCLRLGSAVYLYGRTGPEGGQAEVTLDDKVVASLNLTNAWRTDQVLLFTAGGLDRDKQHHLVLKNLSKGKNLAIDYATLSNIKRASDDTPLAPLIAGVVGGIVVIILLGVVVYLYLMARIRYKVKPALAARGAVESWRKQTPAQSAEACSPCEAYPDGGGMASPPLHTDKPESRTPSVEQGSGTGQRQSRASGHWPIAKLYTRVRRASFFSLRSEGGSSTTSPDYIPYKPPGQRPQTRSERESIPPVPALPSSNPTGQSHRTIFPVSATSLPRGKNHQHQHQQAAKTSPVTPPAIAGLDPFAERWLQENTYVGNTHRPSSDHSRHSSQSPSESSRHGDGPSTGDIEKYEIVGVTHTAVNGRRSIARLWPSRDAVPSLYRSNTLTHAHGPEAMVKDVSLRRSNTLESRDHGITAALQTVPVSASASATVGLGTYDYSTLSSSSFVRPAPAPLNLLSSSATPQPSGYTPSSRNRPQTPLRRGVSIKSAKTVRSFFSGWIKGNGSGGCDESGAGPGAGVGAGGGTRPDTPYRPQTAARPDSGIFPLSLGLGTVDVPLPLGQADRSANMFIELDPSSPLTASRPPSEWQGKLGRSYGDASSRV